MKNEKWSESKIGEKSLLCKTKKEMKNRFPKEYAAAKRMGLLNSSIFSHMSQRFQKTVVSKWSNKENVLMEALKYLDRKSFFKGSHSCYNAAKAKGWFEEACSHMPKNRCIGNPPPTYKWDKASVKKEALLYEYRTDFKERSPGAYDAAVKNRWLDEVCQHMIIVYRSNLTIENLIQIFKTCNTKKEALQKDPSAYVKVRSNGLKDIVFSHMLERIDKSGKNSPFYKNDDEEIKQVALKYDNKIVFLLENPAMYQRAYKRGTLDKICSHMKNPNDGSSIPEKLLLGLVKAVYPNSKKIRDMSVRIKDKPYIKGFDIDIFIPELRKGIEFDGTYWHSFKGLRRRNPKWSDEDIRNYHKFKDDWFKSKGIKILHIKEKDWKSNKDLCIGKCLKFLDVK